MIVAGRNGRRRSIFTKDDAHDRVMHIRSNLTDDEQALVDAIGVDLLSGEEKVMGELNSIYRWQPVSMEQFIEDPYYLGESCATMYPEIKKDLLQLFSRDYNVAIFCLHPDTKIPLLNGKTKKMSELIEQWDKDKTPVWIYSISKNGDVVPACAKDIRYTGMDDYYMVTLDDGSSFRCNARHQMVMRNGIKKMVKDMSIGDSIMPFCTKLSEKNHPMSVVGYEMVFNPRNEKYKHSHVMSYNYSNGSRRKRGNVIHHCDFNKLNNEPSNLLEMGNREHFIFHSKNRKEFLAKNPGIIEHYRKLGHERATDPVSPLRIGHKRFMNSKAGKRLAIENLKKSNVTNEKGREYLRRASNVRWNGSESDVNREIASRDMRDRNLNGLASIAGKLSWENRSEESKKAHSDRVIWRNKNGKRSRQDITIEKIVEVVDGGAKTLAAASIALECSRTRIRSVFKASGVELSSVFKYARNHFIVSIEKCGYGPVCCMTVPEYANFAIVTDKVGEENRRDGVFSSNTGSIGFGKTYITSIAICRTLYELSCLKSPQRTYGLSSGTEMTIPLVSKNLTMARQVLKSAIDDKIKESPYFMTYFPPRVKNDDTLFPNNIRVVVASYTSERIIGSNTFSCILDECVVGETIVDIEGMGKIRVDELNVLLDNDDRMLCFDHSDQRSKYGWFRIKKSSMQRCVRISTSNREIIVSLDHPFLVCNGDILEYKCAKDINTNDVVVRRIEDAEKRTEDDRRSEKDIIRKSEVEDGGEKWIFREEAFKRNNREDKRSQCREEEKAALGGNKTEDVRVAERKGDVGRIEKEDEHGKKRKEVIRRDEGSDLRSSGEVMGRWETRQYKGIDGGKITIVRKEKIRRNSSKDTRSKTAYARNSTYGRVKAANIGGECQINIGRNENIFTFGAYWRWNKCSMSKPRRSRSVNVDTKGAWNRIYCGRRQNGVGGVSIFRYSKQNSSGLHGRKIRREACYYRGEASGCNVYGKKHSENISNVSLLSENGDILYITPKHERSRKYMERSVCYREFHQRAKDRKSKVQADESHGVRKEWCRVSDLPSNFVFEKITDVNDAGIKQTYSICTEFETFIANDIVVHNTNFPPNRKSQQIAVGMGQKKKIAHFDLVEKVYGQILRRIKSRFQVAGGGFPGRLFLSSSAATVESFTERRIRESVDDPNVFVRDHTQWTVKGEKEFSGGMFYVLCSTSSFQSRILAEDEVEQISDEYLEANDAFIMDIPIEYRGDFELNMEEALRDIAGFSTQAISLYIQRQNCIPECINKDRFHPFSVDEWISGSRAAPDWKQLSVEIERRLPGGYIETAYKPRINPDAYRWCHIDIAISGDSCGFTIGHIDRWVEVVRRDAEGNKHVDTAPSYIIDFMLRINPPLGEQIYLPDVRALLYQFMDHGYKFIGLSTDTYMYVEMHQQVKRKGITPHLLSVDTTVDPYDELKSAFYERRIEIYEYHPFIEEFKKLEYDRLAGKIDHPPAGSKDVCDSVAGCVFSLKNAASRMPMEVRMQRDNPLQNENAWVSPLIPANQVDAESVREFSRSDSVGFLPIIFGD